MGQTKALWSYNAGSPLLAPVFFRPGCVAGIEIRLIYPWVRPIKGVPCGNEIFENMSASPSASSLPTPSGTS